jgi:hypothetical protein
MLMKTIDAFRDRTVYRQTEHGAWTAEFHGAVDIHVNGPSLERCRHEMLDRLDEQVCVWLVSTPAAHPQD